MADESPSSVAPAEAPFEPEAPREVWKLSASERSTLAARRLAVFAILTLGLATFGVLVAWGALDLAGRSIDDDALAGPIHAAPWLILALSAILSANVVRQRAHTVVDELRFFDDRIEAVFGGDLDFFFFRQLDAVEIERGPSGAVNRIALAVERGPSLELARPCPVEKVVAHLERGAVPRLVQRYHGLLDLGDEVELRPTGACQERRLRAESISGLSCYLAAGLFLGRFLVDLGRAGTLPFDTLDLPFFIVFTAFGLGLRWEAKRGLAVAGVVINRLGIRGTRERPGDERPWPSVSAEKTATGVQFSSKDRPAIVFSALGWNEPIVGRVIAALPAAMSSPVAQA